VPQQDRLRELVEKVESGSFCTIADAASEFDLSPSYLQHLFKTHTGFPLGRRLAERRLDKAALLLMHSGMSVKEVAYAVGYKHPSSFVRAFRRCFQQVPGDYRQEMLTKSKFG
jgi:AraC-like DNA-binding protein